MTWTSFRNGLAGLAASVFLAFDPPAAEAAAAVERVVSPGGIEAWLVSDDTLPIVGLSFAFRGGAAQDPADKPGVATFLSAMLDEGAGDLDSQAFQTLEEELAVGLGFGADHDSFTGSLRTLSDRSAEAFDLLAQALTAPRFDPEPMERIRAGLLSGLDASATDPDRIASRLFRERTFPDHPYGRPAEGTPESVARITREDLERFRQATFARDGLVIGVVGDITAEALGPLLDATFGGLPARGTLAPVPETRPVTGLSITETVPNAQVIIRVATEGLKRLDPDYMAAHVMNHILGGGSFSSRLYAEVREKRGLAYSVWSALSPRDHAALFLAGTSTRPERAGESLAVIRAEIARMASEGPTEAELSAAKRYLIGNYALRFDTSRTIAGQLVSLQLEGLPIDYFKIRNGLVEAVTLEDVRRAARRILDQPMTVLTVGPEG